MKTKTPQYELAGPVADTFNLAGETGIDGAAEAKRREKIRNDKAEASRRQLAISFEPAAQDQAPEPIRVTVRRAEDPCHKATLAILTACAATLYPQRRD